VAHLLEGDSQGTGKLTGVAGGHQVGGQELTSGGESASAAPSRPPFRGVRREGAARRCQPV
jgi:hypothetical protein